MINQQTKEVPTGHKGDPFPWCLVPFIYIIFPLCFLVALVPFYISFRYIWLFFFLSHVCPVFSISNQFLLIHLMFSPLFFNKLPSVPFMSFFFFSGNPAFEFSNISFSQHMICYEDLLLPFHLTSSLVQNRNISAIWSNIFQSTFVALCALVARCGFLHLIGISKREHVGWAIMWRHLKSLSNGWSGMDVTKPSPCAISSCLVQYSGGHGFQPLSLPF